MSSDFSIKGLESLAPIPALDLSSVQGKGVPDQARIEKVSKAMESLFVGQLTSEFGKSIDGSDSENGPYGDFIQQAMTEGVSKGGGFGLVKVIESYLSKGTQSKLAHTDLNVQTTTQNAPVFP